MPGPQRGPCSSSSNSLGRSALSRFVNFPLLWPSTGSPKADRLPGWIMHHYTARIFRRMVIALEIWAASPALLSSRERLARSDLPPVNSLMRFSRKGVSA